MENVPESLPHPLAVDSSAPRARPIFIKSFVFQPDLPIRIDYEAKGFKTEMVCYLHVVGVF